MLALFLLLLFTEQIYLENPRVFHSKNIHDLADLESYIKLETVDASLLGSVDKAVLDPNRERVLVGDYDSSKSIKIFKLDGSYVQDVGRRGQGPGEFRDKLNGFDVDKHGNIYVLENSKLLKFDADGQFIKEHYLLDDIISSEIEVVNDRIVISLLRTKTKKPHDLHIFDTDLNWKDSFAPYNQFRHQYLYIQPSRLEEHNNHIYISRMYSPEIAVYDLNGVQLKSITSKRINRSAFDDACKTFKKDDKSRRKVKDYTHRFFGFEPFGDKFLISEQTLKPEFMRRLFIIDSNEIIMVNGYSFYRSNHRGKELSLSHIAGHYQLGIIGVVEFDEVWDAKKGDLPGLEKVSLTVEDNPVLLLLTPKQKY